MKREIYVATIAHRSGLPVEEIDATEKASRTGRPRRIGEFDWARSTTINGPTDIYISKDNQQARWFDQLSTASIVFVDEVERVPGVPVSLHLHSLPPPQHH